jgi:predicted MPP superfamily phosphohydrolase
MTEWDRRGVSHRLVLWTQVGLHLALLGGGAWLALAGSRRVLFFLPVVPALFLPFSYARIRLHRALVRQLAHGRGGWVIGALLTAGGIGCDVVLAAQLLTARSTGASLILESPGVSWVGPVWYSAHVLLALGYGLAGLVRRGVRVARRVGRSAARPESALFGRREVLQRMGLVGAGLPFALSVSNVPLSYDFRTDRHDITLPFWPPALDGLRVLHLSDIHVGGAMNRARLRQVAALANAAAPDIVLHTGDFLTHRSGDFDAGLYEALAAIHAPYGQWACFGNHDFDDPRRLETRLRDAGVTVLRNRVATLTVRGKALEIAGADFFFRPVSRRDRYQEIIDGWGARTGAPRILLNHDPSAFDALPEGCADLVLSGHTHGGQIGVQLGTGHALTLVGLAGIPDQGVFTRGDMHMFVTRCVGFYGYPMRLGIPPELALLVLHAAQA